MDALDERRILWIKSVSLDEGVFAYGPDDPDARVHRGQTFELHSSELDVDSLADPSMGDIIALTQHGQLTHLVEVQGAEVTERSHAERKRPHGRRFPFQRTCLALRVVSPERAPSIEEAFGFDPRAAGGEVVALESLTGFREANLPLWMIQRRVRLAIDGELPAQKRRALREGRRTSDSRLRQLPVDERILPRVRSGRRGG